MKHLFILDSGGGAWVHGVRQLFPAPQHQCDPSSDLPAGNISLLYLLLRLKYSVAHHINSKAHHVFCNTSYINSLCVLDQL